MAESCLGCQPKVWAPTCSRNLLWDSRKGYDEGSLENSICCCSRCASPYHSACCSASPGCQLPCARKPLRGSETGLGFQLAPWGGSCRSPGSVASTIQVTMGT